MKLGEKQELFARQFGHLLTHAYILGYQVRIGEVQRTQAQANENARTGVGISNSLHLDKLAGDINLFKDGKYLTDPEEYRALGEFWCSMHELNRWGGNWKTRSDPFHFSVKHRGIE